MGGIEAALLIWRDVMRGAFASEAIRKKTENLPQTERILATSLVYAGLRRAPLWKSLAVRFSGRPLGAVSPFAGDALVLGIAGLIELRSFAPQVLVNALVEAVKKNGFSGETRMVNAVLRKAAKRGKQVVDGISKSRSLRDQSLYGGVPGWVGTCLSDNWGRDEARRLLRLMAMKTYMSLRLSPGVDGVDVSGKLAEAGFHAWPSPHLGKSVRMASSAFPPGLPGFREGRVTPQTESSMVVGEIVSSFYETGSLLEMCCGRGVKTGQIVQNIPGIELEAWELSPSRLEAAKREMKRLGLDGEKVTFRKGDALDLEPQSSPRLIFVDAPCSGSGTWARHPDAKLRQKPERLRELTFLQGKLLSRALDLVASGGVVVYSTCSILRDENERVVAETLGSRPSVVEMPLPSNYHNVHRGRPWGYYLWPTLPWHDGFFLTVLMKRD
ncbi:MAG: RsmB/NOP family class I SAM-dependent RNA methyltransferase [Thermovirgaceae bacterium]